MEVQHKQGDWLFLLICLGLGLLAELSFFHGRIGLSFIVFVAGFYLVLFLRFRLSFYHHRRIGMLIMAAIWVLAGSYLFYDNELFHSLNILIIPVLVFAHVVMITNLDELNWATPRFVTFLAGKLGEGFRYSSGFCKQGFKKVFTNVNVQKMQTVKRVVIGLVLGVPLLWLIIGLLMSADAVFQDMVLRLPTFLLELNFMEELFRTVLVVFLTFLFFGVFQVLPMKSKAVDAGQSLGKSEIRWDSITAVTILIMLNAVYVLFAAIQFTYLFGGDLQDGLTYAEYARKGFFELIFVTLINWSILIGFLKFVRENRTRMKQVMKILYTLLIAVSGVMLASAYYRLSLYEAAYGFTTDRLLAHAFMIFLMVIFAYTFMRVWIERLTLLHFYLIVGLLFYTGLNAINMEQLIVDKNLARYEQTEKIDIYYLDSLSYTGWGGLMDLYEMDPDYPELENLLQSRTERMEFEADGSWQSFNFTEQKVTERLRELDLGK